MFTEAMGQVPAGVGVVTVKDGRDDLGTTVATLLSVSLDPPLVLVSLDSTSYLTEVLLRQDRWAASLLADGQQAIASRFATPGRPSARLLLASTPHHRGEHSEAFVIEGGVTALEVETTRVVPAGDHTLFIGQVLAVAYVDAGKAPLVRLRGRYRPVPGAQSAPEWPAPGTNVDQP
ncbi:reductase [Planotetraspora thailandica]|uniref:Reductase n=1 Tax=Planotetraspora thailandica TaxID=487172 RepID=A0A8J3XXD9_9ACTN|nr:flavin reductase family protein [Planotetraspora thailandica]GII55791.1 reductase [Planotetraspora thailandica]